MILPVRENTIYISAIYYTDSKSEKAAKPTEKMTNVFHGS